MSIKTCKFGHSFHKKSDCPVCPICEEINKPKEGFYSNFNGPVRRALQNAGIHSVEILAMFNQSEILALHGIGKSSIPIFNDLLSRNKLSFKK